MIKLQQIIQRGGSRITITIRQPRILFRSAWQIGWTDLRSQWEKKAGKAEEAVGIFVNSRLGYEPPRSGCAWRRRRDLIKFRDSVSSSNCFMQYFPSI